jgi:hypothetical protein
MTLSCVDVMPRAAVSVQPPSVPIAVDKANRSLNDDAELANTGHHHAFVGAG